MCKGVAGRAKGSACSGLMVEKCKFCKQNYTHFYLPFLFVSMGTCSKACASVSRLLLRNSILLWTYYLSCVFILFHRTNYITTLWHNSTVINAYTNVHIKT